MHLLNFVHNRPYALTSRLHNNDAMLGVKLRARVVLAERIGAQQLSQCAGPGQPGGVACMQGLVLWLQCLAMAHVATFDPQRGWAPFCDVICIRSIELHDFVHLTPFQVVSHCYVENVQALVPNKKGYEVALFESMWSCCEQVHLVMLWCIIIVIVMLI